MACAIHSLQVFSSAQINVFTQEVVDITWKSRFCLIFKDFLELSLGIKIKSFDKGKNNSRVEVDAYCFELLARVIIIKFNLTSCHFEFDVTKKNNNNLIGSYLGTG